MKKAIQKFSVISAALLTLAIGAQAQWTETATSVYLTNGSKPVGIGTNAPSYPLDIKQAGNCNFRVQSITNGSSNLILARSAAAGNNCLVNYKTGATALWYTGVAGNNTDFRIRNGVGTDNLFISQATGFVGINNTAPTVALEVTGSERINGNLHVTNNSTFGASMNVTGNITSSGQISAATSIVTGASSFGGAVNIGNSIFSDDAAGNLSLHGNLIPDNPGSHALGSLTKRWTSVFADEGDFSSNLKVAGTAAVTGATTIGATLGVTGAATMSGGATVSNKLTVSGGINVLSGDISSGGDLYTSSGNGVINCGGDSMSGLINIMSDIFTPGTSNLNANGDEDLFIGGDLEVVGKGYQTGGGAWGVRSDRRLKKDIVDFNDGLEQLMKIHPVKFKYNDLFPNHTEKEYVGIIAQEMQEIAPYMVEELPMGQVVKEDANGKEVIVNPGKNYLTFDPNALWYISVNAIKEQQSIIEKQNERIAALEARLNTSNNSERKSNSNLSSYRLSQNSPNPFNQSTTINFNSGDATQAQIIVRDLNGNLVKSINAVGKTQVIINANELSQGTYTYTLEIAGNSVDTKLMVVTK